MIAGFILNNGVYKSLNRRRNPPEVLPLYCTVCPPRKAPGRENKFGTLAIFNTSSEGGWGEGGGGILLVIPHTWTSYYILVVVVILFSTAPTAGQGTPDLLTKTSFMQNLQNVSGLKSQKRLKLKIDQKRIY
jgi:hypothetical protein